MLIKSLKRRTGTMDKDPKTGEKLSKPIVYDNLNFTCEVPNVENIFGPDYKTIKVKYSDFIQNFKGDIKQLENKDGIFFFDADGHYIGCQVK